MPECQRRNRDFSETEKSLITQISKNDSTDFSISILFNLCNRFIIGVIRDLKEED